MEKLRFPISLPASLFRTHICISLPSAMLEAIIRANGVWGLVASHEPCALGIGGTPG
jgi:hypothetical protein